LTVPFTPKGDETKQSNSFALQMFPPESLNLDAQIFTKDSQAGSGVLFSLGRHRVDL
jgi:hypothetical protein